MIKDTLSGLPDYVRITILAQLKRLLTYKCFLKERDAEDITQDLVLEYLSIITSIPDPTERYVVASLQNKASKILKAKAKIGFGLFSSLEDIEVTYQLASETTGFEGIDYKIILHSIMEDFSDKEKSVVSMMLEDMTIDKISSQQHMSKSTIYAILKKIEKKLKK